MKTGAPLLDVKGLSFSYDNRRPILKNLSLSAEAEGFVSIIGPNGSGKTTLLKIFAGILSPGAGQVFVAGEAVDARKDVSRILSYVPQTLSVDFDIGVLDFVLLGRVSGSEMTGRINAWDVEKSLESLRLVGMEDVHDSDLMKLSGGERQKVFLAKALAQDTEVMLLDEPITYLDLYNQIEMLELLRRLSTSGGKRIVTIMHDLNLAARYSDVCLMLKGGELFAAGRTDEVITAESVRGCFGVEVERIGDLFFPKRIRT